MMQILLLTVQHSSLCIVYSLVPNICGGGRMNWRVCILDVYLINGGCQFSKSKRTSVINETLNERSLRVSGFGHNSATKTSERYEMFCII